MFQENVLQYQVTKEPDLSKMKMRFTVPIQDLEICTNGIKNGLLSNGHSHSSFGIKQTDGDAPFKYPCKYDII